MLRAYGTSDRGRFRPVNEDCFFIDERLGLLVVADGMGGHNAGEIAARLAVDAVAGFVRNPNGAADSLWPFGFDATLSIAANRIRTAIHLANVQVIESAGGRGDYTGMGTTIVAALVDGARLSVGHVGDSRLYRVAGGRARQLTLDDSWVAETIARNPAVDPAALLHHPMRNALTNVIGARSRARVHVMETRLAAGDVLALTTDGVHAVIEDCRLARILAEHERVEAPAALVRAALACGSRDNCTAVVGYYEG